MVNAVAPFFVIKITEENKMANEMILLNGRSYKAKELDFNFVCELGLNGIDITEVQTKIMGAIRVYIAYCMNTDVYRAGDEINLHIINGGTLEGIVDVFSNKAEESDFFHALNKTSEKTTPKRNTKKKEAEVSE